jgi:hypothetical protein
MRSQSEASVVSSDVVRWRREQLRAHGFPTSLAFAVAADRRMDLHALIELVERGCPPALATRILEPLDDRVPD